VRHQLYDPLPLDVVSFDDQQPTFLRRDVGLDSIERVLQSLRRRRLDEVP